MPTETGKFPFKCIVIMGHPQVLMSVSRFTEPEWVAFELDPSPQ